MAVALAKGAWARTKAGIDAGTSELKIAPHIRAFVDASYDITSWETLQGMVRRVWRRACGVSGAGVGCRGARWLFAYRRNEVHVVLE